MAGSRIISFTMISTAAQCWRRFFYQYCAEPRLPKKTDYPRLAGGAIHKHVHQLERPTLDPRPYYFGTKKGAIGSWFNRWSRTLAENRETLIWQDAAMEKKYGEIGAVCIAQYWDRNLGQPRPLMVEKQIQHPYPFKAGVWLMGIIDQVRDIPLSGASLEWLQRIRPEIFENGQLDETYAPVVVLDLKTGYLDYGAQQFKQDPRLEEMVRLQFGDLQEGIQLTLNCWLYEQYCGKRPALAALYHLRSGKIFCTFREEEDYETVFQTVDHLLENKNAESFPKSPNSRNCRNCDYLEPCRGARPFLISQAEDFPEVPTELTRLANPVLKPGQKQMRLKLKGTRLKRPAPEVAPAGASADPQKPIILPYGPWEDKTRQPETAGKEAEPRN